MLSHSTTIFTTLSESLYIIIYISFVLNYNKSNPPFSYIYFCHVTTTQTNLFLHQNEKEATKNHIVNQLKPRCIFKKRFYTKTKSLKINKHLIEDYYYFEHSHQKTQLPIIIESYRIGFNKMHIESYAKAHDQNASTKLHRSNYHRFQINVCIQLKETWFKSIDHPCGRSSKSPM